MRPFLRDIIFGSPWTPKRLPGIVAWFDAADPATRYQLSSLTTPAAADTDPVGGLVDKSGRGRHATQATAGLRPILKLAIQNSLPGIRGDGADDELDNLALGGLDFSSLSVYIAAKGFAPPAVNATWLRLRDSGAGNQLLATQILTTNKLRFSYDTSTGANALDTAAAVTAAFVAVYTVDAANNYLYRVNAAELSGTHAGTKLVRSVNWLNLLSDGATPTGSDIYEALVYNAAHSRATALKVESYLRAKWGI
jgi:hypothetical protein